MWIRECILLDFDILQKVFDTKDYKIYLESFSRENFPEAGMLNCGASHVFNIY